MRSLFGIVLICLLASSAAVAAPGRSDKLTVDVARAGVVANSPSSESRVAMQFDLPELRAGTGRRIEEAFLELEVRGIPSERLTEYFLYACDEQWSVDSEGSVNLSNTDEQPVATWEISPSDHDAGFGGILRFDVRSLVQNWTDQTLQNYGVMLSTGDVSSQALIGQIGSAHLVIRYGFRN